MGVLLNMLGEYLLYEILFVTWLLHFWTFYLSIRQKRLMERLVDVPESVKSWMTKDVYDKARQYALDNTNFAFIKEFYVNIFDTVFLLTFAYYYCWEWSIQIGKAINISPENDILISAICMFVMNIISTIRDLPIKVYHTFVLEEKHKFNKQSTLFFIKDQLLKFVVIQIIALPLLCGIIWIIKNGGDYFFLYLWIFTAVMTLFLTFLYPEVIAPLFDKYSPLPDGELKTKIEELAASLNFPLYKLFIVEGSKRSSHSNAYLYGFFKHKRIVLFDTLVKEYYKGDEKESEKDHGCDTDEILAVLAHELGHWSYSHTLKQFYLFQVNFMINFVLFAKLLNYSPMYAAFGFTNSQPVFIGLLIVISYILIPWNTLLQIITIQITRRFEFQADRFAAQLGRGEALKNALIKLNKDNLAFPLFDKLYSAWHHTHPPVVERLEAIDKKDK